MQLADAVPGQRFRVIRVVSGGEIGKRLVDLGFISGAEGEVVRAALFRGPMQIRLGDYDLIMRRHEARLIDIEIGAAQPSTATAPEPKLEPDSQQSRSDHAGKEGAHHRARRQSKRR